MKKLTKDQKQYRKRKKEGSRDTKFIKRKDGRRVEVIAKRSLCVRVSNEAAERLANCAEERNISRGELLSHMLNWGIGQVLDVYTSWWREPTPDISRKDIKYKGTKGDKQLNLSISSTSWNKLEDAKAKCGLSKARMVQTIILYYTFQTPEQLAKQKLGAERREQEQKEWRRNFRPQPPTQEQQEEFRKHWEEYEAKRQREQDAFFDSIKESYTEKMRKEGRLSDSEEETS